MIVLKKIAFFTIFVIFFISECNSADNNIVSARMESCPGCKLKRLTQVRLFLYEDVPKYDNVEWKRIQGASPVAIFLNEADEEVERVDLEPLNREQCNDLLKEKGFKIREQTAEKEL